MTARLMKEGRCVKEVIMFESDCLSGPPDAIVWGNIVWLPDEKSSRIPISIRDYRPAQFTWWMERTPA